MTVPKTKKVIALIGIITSVVAVTVLTFILYIGWSFKVEDYCQKKAQSIVGDNWGTLYSPTPDEEKYLGHNGQITLGFREQLKCEKDPLTLEKFKALF